MGLTELRKSIDSIDEEISRLFKQRMELVAEVAKYKKENEIPILNSAREREILEKVSSEMGEPFDKYGRTLFETLLDVSRAYQEACIAADGE